MNDVAYDTRKVAAFGLIGFLAALTVISAVTFMGEPLYTLLFPAVAPKTGTLLVKVTDAPVRDLEHLNLTISSVEVLNETGGWVTLPIEGGQASFDLLLLENVTRDLAVGEIEPGNYTKIRMEIVSANATLADESVVQLRVPPGHVDINVRFEVKVGETTSVIIDIIVDRVNIAERGRSGQPANLNPQFKPTVIPPG